MRGREHERPTQGVSRPPSRPPTAQPAPLCPTTPEPKGCPVRIVGAGTKDRRATGKTIRPQISRWRSCLQLPNAELVVELSGSSDRGRYVREWSAQRTVKQGGAGLHLYLPASARALHPARLSPLLARPLPLLASAADGALNGLRVSLPSSSAPTLPPRHTLIWTRNRQSLQRAAMDRATPGMRFVSESRFCTHPCDHHVPLFCRALSVLRARFCADPPAASVFQNGRRATVV